MAGPPDSDSAPDEKRLVDPARSRTELAPETPRAPQHTSPIQDLPVLVDNRYEIKGLLGSGAMGTVYRARDRELDEMVALKVLKGELAKNPSILERFKREVKLARKVTHKNVARTFDIGDHAGERFLTMEYVEGEMLGTRISRLGRLTPHEAVSITIDVADGLAAAHEAGVLHRDLKPENVIIARDGRAVITDFGIARALESAELTATFVGTPGYMAPEQVEGRDLDARADLYALGTMLYELLTGRMAWNGDSVIAIATARLLREPPDARSIVGELPDGLSRIVLKLMARSRDERFASAAETRAALVALGTVESTPLPPKPRPLVALPPAASERGGLAKAIAVLPLLALSGPEDTYLAESVTDDVVDLLSVVPGLRIRPRGATAKHTTPDRDVREIGTSVGADAVIDGSLRRVGDRVRISVRLIAVADGFQLWARRFDRAAAEVLDVADEAASAIAEALATDRIAATLVDAPRPPPIDPAAQDLYLRSRHALARGWYDRADEAIAFLRDAHARAPEEVRITALLALGLARAYRIDSIGPEAATEARALAEEVLAKEPENPMGRVVLGAIHFANGEATAAAGELYAALKRAPSNVDGLDLLGRILVEIDRADEGLAILENAIAHEPGLDRARYDIARVHALRGDTDASQNAMGPPPADIEIIPWTMLKARFAIWADDRETARALLATLDTGPIPSGARPRVLLLFEIALARKLTPESRRYLEELTEVNDRHSARRVTFLSQIRTEGFLACGAIEEAMVALRRADENGLLDLLWLRRCHLFKSAREHPTYRAVVASAEVRAKRVLAAFGSETASPVIAVLGG